jgi:acyl carrier protein
VHVVGRPVISNQGTLEIAGRVTLLAQPAAIQLVTEPGGSLVIREGAFLDTGVTIRACRRVEIGKNAYVGAFCLIDDGGASKSGGAQPITIGEGAWVEEGATLLPGAVVAPGARIAGGAVVGGREQSPPPPVPLRRRTADAEHVARVRSTITKIVRAAEGVPLDAELTRLKGWDSLAALRVLVALETEFKLVFPSDFFATSCNLGSVSEFVTSRGAPADAPL